VIKSNHPKSDKSKVRRPSTTRSTAGPGYDFEDQVAVWLLTKMLCGEAIPGIGVPGNQLKFQTSALGWIIDDLLVSGLSASGEEQKLAISCKSSVQVTTSGLPADFIGAAWQQWESAAPMNRGSDCLALVTRGRNPKFDATWSDIKGWCNDTDSSSATAKINKSPKHKKVFDSVKKPSMSGNTEISEEDVVSLIRIIQVLPLDFQLAHSENKNGAIMRLRGLLRSGNHEGAKQFWEELEQKAKNARLNGHTILLTELWQELSKTFDLKNHPNFSSSWDVLTSVTSENRSYIETALPSGYEIERTNDVGQILQMLDAEVVNILYGESGSGKSAFIKSTLDNYRPDWVQTWLKPEELEIALSAAKRSKLGLTHPLVEVLSVTTHAHNILVIDAAERLTSESHPKIKRLIEQLILSETPEKLGNWRIIIIGQTEALINGRLHALVGKSRSKTYELEGVSPKDVKAALRPSESLRWLAVHDDTVAILTNIQTLAWVVQAETQFQEQSKHNVISHQEIVDRLWRFWTDDKPTLKSLLMRLAEREASFEHSFMTSEMEPADIAAFEARPAQFPLRLNDRNHIVFQHDLAADWARFQRLKEISHDTLRWAELAKNPLWVGALRMLGQYLLRQSANSQTAWDVAFSTVEKVKNSTPLAVDIMLDALFLDRLAQAYLTERTDLLLANHGAHLNRLLRRFQHVATIPDIPLNMLNADPSLQLYLEAQHRTPILHRWPAIAGFLTKNQERIVELISPVVAKVCEIWLTKTPVDLGSGVAMPYRREFVDVALATARALQVAQGKHVIFMDDSEKPIYTAAFSAAADAPDDVAEWALEMAQRRPWRKVISEKISAFHRKKADEHAARLRDDAEYREREQRRQSFPTMIGGSRKLPPWPLGAKNRVEKDFHECCVHSGALGSLMKIRPKIAAEILLAVIIDDSPEESYSDEYRLDRSIGLNFDHESYPTAFWKSQFFLFLQINPDVALTALIALVEFCTERFLDGISLPRETKITLNDGIEQNFVGNHMVFDWAQSNSTRSGQLYSALAALERWLCLKLEKNEEITSFVDRILHNSKSVSFLGVLVNVGKFRLELFKNILRPLLGCHELYIWDDYRVEQTRPISFDSFSWIRTGETVFEMAKQWTLAPYREVTLRNLTAHLVCTDSNVADFLDDAVQLWTSPSGDKEVLEFRILKAELNWRNYSSVDGGKSGNDTIEFRYPSDLEREISKYKRATLPKIQMQLLPYNCQEFLRGTEMLTDQQAEGLALALNTVTGDGSLDEDAKRQGLFAVASTLAARATDWLTRHLDVHRQVNEIIQNIVASIGDSPESLRRSFSLGDDNALQFAAHAVMAQWIGVSGGVREWEPSVLRILTSGDGAAIGTMISIAHANRALLGPKWWRLLQLALLSSGLSILTPRVDDPKSVEANWLRWLRWLRLRSLDCENTDVEAISPLAIALRVERLQRARWRRAYSRGEGQFHRSPEERRSSGLDPHLLGHIFV